MIELRWVVFGQNKQLEYRVITPFVDASGALCPGSEWYSWKIVPEVDADEAANDDMRASGGLIWDAPNDQAKGRGDGE